MSKSSRRRLKLLKKQKSHKQEPQTAGTRIMNMSRKNFSFCSNETEHKVTELRKTAAATPVVPSVFYSEEAYAKINYLVDKCQQEVGWLGSVEVVPDGYFITDIFIFKQTVTGTETDISADAMGELIHKLYDMYPDFDSSKMYYWGHSHVNMGVSPSGQDEAQIDEFLENCDIFIRGIYNKRGQSKVDVYDVHQQKVFQCVQAGIRKPELTVATKLEMDELIAENVISRVYTQSAYTASHYNNGHYATPKNGNQYNSGGYKSPAQRMHEARSTHLAGLQNYLDDVDDGLDAYDWGQSGDETRILLPASKISKVD